MKEEKKMNWAEEAFKEIEEDVKEFKRLNPDFSEEDIEEAIKKVRRERYSLTELLSKVTPENIHKEVNSGKSVGREKW